MTETEHSREDRERFMARFGEVAEHSPWVAAAVWDADPEVAQSRDPVVLSDAFGRAVRSAPREQCLELLRAHPDLACGVRDRAQMGADSQSEQAGAGLDQCTPEEFIEFQSLNLAYREEFGFPFIIAVSGLDRREILKRFRDRIERSEEAEFKTAVENVIRIIGFRLEKILSSHG